jgi:hypothetical protein
MTDDSSFRSPTDRSAMSSRGVNVELMKNAAAIGYARFL